MAGWIKLYRDIQNHWIWKDPLRLKWWVDLLLLANHKEGKTFINGELISIEAGEHLTSEIKLAERWGVSRGRVHRFLQLLENDGMILQKKCKQNGTTIKVSNYGLYQAFSATEYATDNTTLGTTDGQQAIQRAVHKQEVYKNDKEGKKERNVSKPPRAANTNFTPPTHDEVITYCQERGNSIDADRFIDFYASKGWLVGKAKMKDWKAAVRTWEKNNNLQNADMRSCRKETVNERNNRLLDDFFGRSETIDGAGTTPLIERHNDEL